MSSENTYSIKHKRQTDKDISEHIHRYTFRYNGCQYECCIDDSDNIVFDNDNIPVKIRNIIKAKIIENLEINGLRI